MDGHNVVAVYRSRADAEMARDRLIEFGIPRLDIRMSDTVAASAGTAPIAGTTAAPVATEHRGGFWDWLFGRDVPERERGWYEENLREGRTVLSVLVRDQVQHERVADILDEFDPIEFTGMGEAEMPATGMAISANEAPVPGARAASTSGGAPPSTGAIAGERGAREEQVIPVVKEELAVGKRATERRYRIRTYVTETPVERDVTLRDERVVVERRPVAGDRQIEGADLPQEREFEVTERHEEPVVERRARETEQVVVRREADERTERVRDTVRETKVDVESEAGGAVENRRGTPPKPTP